MRITTFNVNGIRSAYEKGLLKWVEEENPDFLCLQETKAKPKQLSADLRMESNLFEEKDYFTYFNSAEKPGYSGVAIYSLKKAQSINKQLGYERLDKEGRFLSVEYENFKLATVYLPHGGRDKENLDYKLEAYETLLEYLKNEEKDLILCGDFNVARDERDLERAKENKNNIMFTKKEREQLKQLLGLGFYDTFREQHEDSGHYSWFPYAHNAKERNLGWRLDYIFVSEALNSNLEETEILKEINMSDHCPVVARLNI
ncbi:MAG: exodeoxyribonuclease III [Candidatus Paceibacterota bacterium]